MSTKPRRQLLTVKEVAAELACSRDHVYDLIARGDLPAIDIGAGRALTRLRPDDVDDYLQTRLRRAPKAAS